MRLIYEAHSTTTDNENGIATGWNEGELSETGRQRAADLGTRYRTRPPHLVISFDLRRATQTVDIAFGDSAVPTRTDARLRECNYGDLNGTPAAVVHADRLRNVEEPFPNGESYRDVVERTRLFLEDLTRGEEERVVLVAHGAQYFALEHLINGVPLEDIVAAPRVWQPGWRFELTR